LKERGSSHTRANAEIHIHTNICNKISFILKISIPCDNPFGLVIKFLHLHFFSHGSHEERNLRRGKGREGEYRMKEGRGRGTK
jgi:hypothetical protein